MNNKQNMERVASLGAKKGKFLDGQAFPSVRVTQKRVQSLANSKKPSSSNSLKFFLGLRPHEQINTQGFNYSKSPGRGLYNSVCLEPEKNGVNFKYFKKSQDFLFSKYNREVFEKNIYKLGQKSIILLQKELY